MGQGSGSICKEPVAAEEFAALRPYLFAVAYRLLGSASDAEDIVQDAYLRLRGAPSAEVASPKAYLAAIVTRLCLDHLKSARVARETYLGPWLPEPAPTADIAPSPADAAERREEISLAFLTLLERLTAEERAAYVLHEAFEKPYDEIATMIGKSVAATRQLAHRARVRLADGRPRFTASLEAQRRLTESFLAATRRGDLQALTAALAEDVTVWNDGGAETLAARRPIHGRDVVARFLIGVTAKIWTGTRVSFAGFNGGIGVLLWDGDELKNATMLDGVAGRVQAIRSVSNPTKLAYLARRCDPPTAPD
jgi:RNA polymerase sigma-70 factor (ECF subfamily)